MKTKSDERFDKCVKVLRRRMNKPVISKHDGVWRVTALPLGCNQYLKVFRKDGTFEVLEGTLTVAQIEREAIRANQLCEFLNLQA